MRGKGKLVAYVLLPTLGLAGVLGANFASAHGMFGGFGAALSPDDIATRQSAKFQNEANILGLSVDEIKNAWAQGKSVKDLAAEKGISQDQISARIKDARFAQIKNQLKALVDKGIITQAQADSRLKFMQDRIQNLSNGKGRRGMHGFGMGMF